MVNWETLHPVEILQQRYKTVRNDMQRPDTLILKVKHRDHEHKKHDKHDKRDQNHYVLKIMQAKNHVYNLNPSFLNEVLMSRYLLHPNVVQVLDAKTGSELPISAMTKALSQHVNTFFHNSWETLNFILMPFAPYGDLHSFLKSLKKSNYLASPCPLVTEILPSLTNDILEGIKHIHGRNVVIQDLKPTNILLFSRTILNQGEDRKEERYSGNEKKEKNIARYLTNGKCNIRAVIADLKDCSLLSKVGEQYSRGTINYMAPEVLISVRPLDTIRDMWSLGKILLRMFYPLQSDVRRPNLSNKKEKNVKKLKNVRTHPNPKTTLQNNKDRKTLADSQALASDRESSPALKHLTKPGHRPEEEDFDSLLVLRSLADEAFLLSGQPTDRSSDKSDQPDQPDQGSCPSSAGGFTYGSLFLGEACRELGASFDLESPNKPASSSSSSSSSDNESNSRAQDEQPFLASSSTGSSQDSSHTLSSDDYQLVTYFRKFVSQSEDVSNVWKAWCAKYCPKYVLSNFVLAAECIKPAEEEKKTHTGKQVGELPLLTLFEGYFHGQSDFLLHKNRDEWYKDWHHLLDIIGRVIRGCLSLDPCTRYTILDVVSQWRVIRERNKKQPVDNNVDILVDKQLVEQTQQGPSQEVIQVMLRFIDSDSIHTIIQSLVPLSKTTQNWVWEHIQQRVGLLLTKVFAKCPSFLTPHLQKPSCRQLLDASVWLILHLCSDMKEIKSGKKFWPTIEQGSILAVLTSVEWDILDDPLTTPRLESCG